MTDPAGHDPAELGLHELAVVRDLKALSMPTDAGKRDSSTELVLTLARALDSSPALPLVVKLAQELRIQMAQVREVARERDRGASANGGLSTPDWDTPDTGPADVGAAGGGGRAAAG